MNTEQWTKIPYFQPEEFLCRCGCGRGPERMAMTFVDHLRMARLNADLPFYITSGYRCSKHNAEIGAIASSSHVRGYAADIACSGSRSRAIIIKAAIMAEFHRIGIAKGFIHLDMDPDKPEMVFWVY